MSEVASEVSEEIEVEEDYAEEDFESAHSLSAGDPPPRPDSRHSPEEYAEAMYSDDFAASRGDPQEQEAVYSDDFESSLMRSVRFEEGTRRNSPHTRREDASSSTAGQQEGTSRSLMQGLLPSPGVLTPQAEVLMDELGKEVVRLRNEQRLMLRERRAQAKVKKERADARRAEHMQELNRHKDIAAKLQLENEALKAQVREANLRCSSLEDEKNSAERSISVLESHLASANASLERLRSEHDSLSASFAEDRRKWDEERSRLSEEVTRLRLSAEVVQRTSEVNEDRLRRDRERLPEHHRQRLEDELGSLREKERLLEDRLAAAKAEEERRVLAAESLRREVMKELDQGRMRLEMDSEEAR